MSLTFIILLVVLITKCSSNCVSFSLTSVSCNSVQDILRAGEQDYWNALILQNSDGKKENIQANLFSKIQNLEKLVFNNTVNDLENKPFESLTLLEKVHFVNCDLPVIKYNWLSNLPVEQLIISKSKVTTFEPKCFENSNLKNVNIEGNSIFRIDTNVFSNTYIEILYLNNNKIRFIEDDAFTNMPKLLTLSLERNILIHFDPKLIIGSTSPKLHTLWLSNNKIQYVNKDHFDVFPNLRILILHQNQIVKIYDGAFNGVPKLSYLDISNNYLKSVHEEIVPVEGLTYLDILFLHNNRLNYLTSNFIKKFPILTKITIGGNPWQCGCFNKIIDTIYYNNAKIVCDDEYLNGQRPVCIVSPDNSCLENLPNADQLYNSFKSSLSNYKQLKPFCRIHCDRIGFHCYDNDFNRWLQFNN